MHTNGMRLRLYTLEVWSDEHELVLELSADTIQHIVAHYLGTAMIQEQIRRDQAAPPPPLPPDAFHRARAEELEEIPRPSDALPPRGGPFTRE